MPRTQAGSETDLGAGEDAYDAASGQGPGVGHEMGSGTDDRTDTAERGGTA